MAAIRNFFSLQSLKSLHKQLHHKPDTLFSTVGEVIKHRDALIRAEEIDMENVWLQTQKRNHFLSLVEAGIVESNDYWVDVARSQISDYKEMFEIRSAKRSADIRAITTFCHRCGIEA